MPEYAPAPGEYAQALAYVITLIKAQSNTYETNITYFFSSDAFTVTQSLRYNTLRGKTIF